MTSFFPTLYPDEILYSAIARYHQRSGNISWKHTADDLLGYHTRSISKDLPKNIMKIMENIPGGDEQYGREIVFKHTLYPYYAVFLTESRRKKIMSLMLEGGRSNVHANAGLLTSSISPSIHLRYCIKCFVQDEETHGESYWHRIHQAPGVLICPYHPTEILRMVTTQNISHQMECVSPPISIDCQDIDLECSSVKRIDNSQTRILEYIAQATRRIIEEELVLKEADMTLAYQTSLVSKNLGAVNGNIKQKQFVEYFMSYYGKDLLQVLDCSIDKNSGNNWLCKMIRKSTKSVHPLKHIMMMNFCGISLDDLPKLELGITPFGNGPWRCYNRASSHYGENVADKISISSNYKDKELRGTIYCKCGFVYTVSENNEQGYKGIIVNERGDEWEQKLKELVQARVSYRKIGKILGVDGKTASKYAMEQGAEKSGKMDKLRTDKQKHLNYENVITNKRKVWMDVSEKNPYNTKAEVRKLIPDIYAWLYRNDREWMVGYKNRKRELIYKSHVDWKKRDEEVLEKTIQAVQYIKTQEGNPMRVTKSNISRFIGNSTILYQNINKLSKTKQYLETALEDLEDYHHRKIKWATEELILSGVTVTQSKIKRKAGLKN